jgi:hypothetical protein
MSTSLSSKVFKSDVCNYLTLFLAFNDDISLYELFSCLKSTDDLHEIHPYSRRQPVFKYRISLFYLILYMYIYKKNRN